MTNSSNRVPRFCCHLHAVKPNQPKPKRECLKMTVASVDDKTPKRERDYCPREKKNKHLLLDQHLYPSDSVFQIMKKAFYENNRTVLFAACTTATPRLPGAARGCHGSWSHYRPGLLHACQALGKKNNSPLRQKYGTIYKRGEIAGRLNLFAPLYSRIDVV